MNIEQKSPTAPDDGRLAEMFTYERTNIMGCDIHGYIEFHSFDTHEGEPHYSLFAGNMGDRDYAMFGILAGVRRGGCVYPQRGLPEHAGFEVTSAFYLWVTEDSDGDGCVSKEKANEWVKDGFSKWISDNQITHPDWHSASWLNAEEFEVCLNKRKEILNYGNVSPEWFAVLAAMKELPGARFVFWFDN